MDEWMERGPLRQNIFFVSQFCQFIAFCAFCSSQLGLAWLGIAMDFEMKHFFYLLIAKHGLANQNALLI